MTGLNPGVVLAAIDAVLEVDPRSPARVSIMTTRLRKLRAQVEQYVVAPADVVAGDRLLHDVSAQEYADLVNGRTTLDELGVPS